MRFCLNIVNKYFYSKSKNKYYKKYEKIKIVMNLLFDLIIVGLGDSIGIIIINFFFVNGDFVF